MQAYDLVPRQNKLKIEGGSNVFGPWGDAKLQIMMPDALHPEPIDYQDAISPILDVMTQ